jgi:alcohol dehydrogenase YqhD (iron-dependent ADH family)
VTGLKFDWTINVNTVIAATALILTMMHYGNVVVSYLHNQNTKINIMWAHFYSDNSSILSPEEKEIVKVLKGEE